MEFGSDKDGPQSTGSTAPLLWGIALPARLRRRNRCLPEATNGAIAAAGRRALSAFSSAANRSYSSQLWTLCCVIHQTLAEKQIGISDTSPGLGETPVRRWGTVMGVPEATGDATSNKK